jgi:hypothetical protein
MTTSQKDTVVSVDSVEETDESPKTNFFTKAVSSVTKFVTDHPLLVWGGVAVVAGAVAVALAPKEEILKSIEDDSVDISTTTDENGNLVTTITEAAPEETSSNEE